MLSRRPVRTHTFRGRRYSIRRLLPSRMPKAPKGYKRTLGQCDDPKERSKTILFDRTVRGRERLDLEIHEALHACLPDTDEDAVDTTATDLAKFLWRLGYRVGEE